MAEKKRLSVAEMLAAARAQTADASSVAPDAVVPVLVAESAPPEPAESAAAEVPVVAQPPKAITAKPAGTGGRPSVADIMAAARANKAASTLKGPPLAHWSAMRFASQTTANWKSTRAKHFMKNSASGPMLSRISRFDCPSIVIETVR